MTVGEAAARLGVSIGTVRRYYRRGLLAHVRLPGGDVRIEDDALDAFLAAHRVEAAPVDEPVAPDPDAVVERFPFLRARR